MAKKTPRRENKVFKYAGGFLKSEVFHYGEDDPDEHIFAEVWGHVIHNPIIRTYNMQKIEFAIRYMRGGYILVNIWGDTPAAQIASTLKAQDMVVCRGIITKHRYTSKLGERESRILSAFSVEKPEEHTLFIQKLYNSPAVHRLLDSDEGDVMESAKDYLPEEEEQEQDELPFM